MRRASGITLSILAMVAAVSLLPVAAAASTITQTYSFTASGFTPLFPGASAPMDPVSGDVTLTFDPLVATQGTVDAINLTIAAHTYTPAEVGFTYPFATNTIFIGGEL